MSRRGRIGLGSLVAGALAAALPACSDGPTGPGDLLVYGTYAAVAIDGSPLPFHGPSYEADGDTCSDTVEAARLTLRPSGTYRLLQVMEIDCDGGAGLHPVVVSHGDFTRVGDTLTFLAVDELGTGTLLPDVVEFDPATLHPYYPTRFRFLSGDTVGAFF